MRKVRIEFEKQGMSRYISHLDLTHLFARALSRAQVEVKHSEGFHVRPILVFGAPLSLGFDGQAELLDITLMDDSLTNEQLMDRLHGALPGGMKVVRVYEPQRKVGEIGYGVYHFTCECQADENLLSQVRALFAQEEVVVLKHTKRGEAEANIIPLIHKLEWLVTEEGYLRGDCILALGDTGNLNPQYLVKALERYIPGWHSDYESYVREGFLDKNLEKFA